MERKAQEYYDALVSSAKYSAAELEIIRDDLEKGYPLECVSFYAHKSYRSSREDYMRRFSGYVADGITDVDILKLLNIYEKSKEKKQYILQNYNSMSKEALEQKLKESISKEDLIEVMESDPVMEDAEEKENSMLESRNYDFFALAILTRKEELIQKKDEQIEKKDARIERLLEQKELLEDKVKQLNTQMEQIKEEKLSGNIPDTGYMEEMEELREQLDEQRNEMECLKTENDEAKSRAESLQQESVSKDKENEELKEQVEKLLAQQQILHQRMAQMQDEQSEREHSQTERNEEAVEWKEKYEAVLAELETGKATYSAVLAERDFFKEQIEELKADYQKLRDFPFEEERDYAEVVNQIESLKKENEQLKRELSERSDTAPREFPVAKAPGETQSQDVPVSKPSDARRMDIKRKLGLFASKDVSGYSVGGLMVDQAVAKKSGKHTKAFFRKFLKPESFLSLMLSSDASQEQITILYDGIQNGLTLQQCERLLQSGKSGELLSQLVRVAIFDKQKRRKD